MRTTHALPLIGGGFLLSVLWFDLKFDVLVLPQLTSSAPFDATSLAAMRPTTCRRWAPSPRAFRSSPR